MPTKHKLCALMLLVFLAIQLNAQLNGKLEHYSTENGLCNNHVMCITKCSEGFMWFGTWDGISRFDGQNFKTYTSRPGDSSTLKSTRIDFIVEDKAGYLWLKAYDNQIYRFDKKTGVFLAVADLLAKINIRDIVFDKINVTATGQVWLFTKNQGIFNIQNTGVGALNITRYSTSNSGNFNLPSNTINFFFEDRDGSAWIGTEKGLCLLSIDKSQSYKKLSIDAYTPSTEQYTCVGEDAKRVWLGTSSGTLYAYEKATSHFSSKKVSANQINAVCISKNNNTLYATTSASELITLNTFNDQANNSIIPTAGPFTAIYEDRAGQLWLQPQSQGIVKYNPIEKKFKYFFQENGASAIRPIYNIFEDNENRIWIRIGGAGLAYYNGETDVIEYFDKDPTAITYQLSSVVVCRYLDTSGVLWFSTVNRGIEKMVFQRNDFAPKYLVKNAINKLDNEIRGVCNDHKGRVWIAAKSGKVSVFDMEGTPLPIVFVNEPATGIGSVYSILQARNGAIWLGTKGNGLFKAEPVDDRNMKYKLTNYLNNKNDSYSVSSNLIYSLLEDSKGRLWVGTYENGINLLEEKDGMARFVNCKNGFKNYPISKAGKVRYLQQDAEGNLWIGTTNGLVISNTASAVSKEFQFHLYQRIAGVKESLGNNDVQFIFRDSKGLMWVATSGGGLNHVTGNVQNGIRFKVFTTDDGLPSNYLLSITEDNKGNLWMSTENGLSKFNTKQQQFRNYDSYDGLPQTVFSEATAARLSNGKLFFGCINGYLIFSPEKITYQKMNAALALTNLQINNKDVLPSDPATSILQIDVNNTKSIELRYDENVISIDFRVLDYRANNKQAYAYRLVGFDKEWNNVIDQHKATYTNLAPGKYVFEVKNLSTELYTKEPFKKLSITILPPPWKTVWAYLLYFILFLIIAEIVRRTLSTMIRLRNRISVEQRLTELKLNFFTNISHELRTPLTLIVNPVDEVLQKEKLSIKGQEHLNLARKNINRMVRFVNQLLDFRKLQNGKMNLKFEMVEIVSFVKEVSSHFSETAYEKHLEFLVTSNANELFVWIDPDKMDIVIYNLLSNAFKFSGNGKTVVVDIKRVNNLFFTIEVIDQGIGVPQDELDDIFELYYEVDKVQNKHYAGTGIGLALSKEIVQLHHGKIGAQNNQNTGLTVTLELKIGEENFKRQNFKIPVTDKAANNEQPTVQAELIPVMELASNESPLVLIVEDNIELRSYLADQLNGYYRIAEAENGKQGLAKAIALMPDLILSDVMMPEMDGIQLLDQLKNGVATSHIPVILLTAKSSIDSQIEGMKYGADYYITKPFNTQFILASIGNLIKQRKKFFEILVSKEQDLKESAPEPNGSPKLDVQEDEKIVITAKDEAFLNKVIGIVELEMVDFEFNVDKLAEQLLMSRSTFFKKFKSLTNMPPVEFIRDSRLARAKEMLDAGEDNIATIAFETGFGSTKYFSACFKDKYEMLPSEYAKMSNSVAGKNRPPYT